MEFVPIWYYDRHWSKVFISTSALMTVTLTSRSQNLNVKVFLEVFKTSLLPNLITSFIHLWFDDKYFSKITHYHPHHPRSCQGQGHRLRIFMLKFYIEVFRISLLLNYTMDLVPIWHHDRYWSIVFISTHDRDLEVEVTDLEFKC